MVDKTTSINNTRNITNIKDYELSKINYKSNITTLSSFNNNLNFVSADQEGKMCIWDIKSKKAIKYINTGIKKKINEIKIITTENDNDDCNKPNSLIFFSQGNSIKYIDANINKIIVSQDLINTLYIYNEPNSEIEDFEIKEETLIFNDQENDKFVIYNDKDKTTTFETISNCFSQVIVDNKTNDKKQQDVIFVTFEGKILKYNITDKTFYTNEKHLKNFLNKEVYDNYLTNPPYVSCCLIDTFQNLLVLGLLNGIIMTFKAGSLKKNSLKSVHETSVLKIIPSNCFETNIQISLGKNKKICVLENYSEIKLIIDLNIIYNLSSGISDNVGIKEVKENLINAINENESKISSDENKKEKSENSKIEKKTMNVLIYDLIVIDRKIIISDTLKDSLKVFDLVKLK